MSFFVRRKNPCSFRMVLASMARKVNALLHGFTFACLLRCKNHSLHHILFVQQKIPYTCMGFSDGRKNPYTFTWFLWKKGTKPFFSQATKAIQVCMFPFLWVTHTCILCLIVAFLPIQNGFCFLSLQYIFQWHGKSTEQIHYKMF
jgi:hypothetical protein